MDCYDSKGCNGGECKKCEAMNGNRKWYRVRFEDCFYDDMDGALVGVTSKTYLLEIKFSSRTDIVMFYKNQVKFIGEF